MAATSTALQQHSFTETYHDVENLVYKTVHEFIARYGGEFEEQAGDAHLSFVLAYHTYKEGKTKFSYWTRFTIWTELLEKQRESLRRRLPSVSLFADEGKDGWDAETPHSGFCLMEFLDELTEDARIVARLAVDTPLGLANQMVERGGSGTARRSVLRNYLEGLGWTAERIKESFTEIAHVLKTFP